MGNVIERIPYNCRLCQFEVDLDNDDLLNTDPLDAAKFVSDRLCPQCWREREEEKGGDLYEEGSSSRHNGGPRAAGSGVREGSGDLSN